MNTYPLTAEQRYFYDYQNTAPNTTMYNHFPMLVRFKGWISMERLIYSLTKAIDAHPAYSIIIDVHNGEPVQRFIPGIIAKIPVDRIRDAELMSIKDELIQPFTWGEAMCRFRIFITEKAKYLFWDDHHIVCDALGKVDFWCDFQRAYNGEKLKTDSWFEYLTEREAEKSSPRYDECRRWYESTYGKCTDFLRYPETDFENTGQNRQGLFRIKTGITESDLEILRHYHLTRTEFFTAASLLATAEYNHDSRVIITWTHNGRHSKKYHSMVGLTIEDIPAAMNLAGMTADEIFASVREQFRECLRHRYYPYAVLDEAMMEDDNLCVIYQGRIYSDGPVIDIFDGLIGMKNKYAASQNILDVEILEADGGIELMFNYAAHRYKSESIERFSEIYLKCAHDLLRGNIHV